jgi:hypothetical protein
VFLLKSLVVVGGNGVRFYSGTPRNRLGTAQLYPVFCVGLRHSDLIGSPGIISANCRFSPLSF